jgi:hypothetical protein
MVRRKIMDNRNGKIFGRIYCTALAPTHLIPTPENEAELMHMMGGEIGRQVAQQVAESVPYVKIEDSTDLTTGRRKRILTTIMVNPDEFKRLLDIEERYNKAEEIRKDLIPKINDFGGTENEQQGGGGEASPNSEGNVSDHKTEQGGQPGGL